MTRASGVLPASAGAGGAAPTGGVRRTKDVTPCSGTGAGSFNSVPANANVAAGIDSVVGGGTSDLACDDYAIVVGGYYNYVNSGTNSAEYGFVGGGYSNEIMSGVDSVIAGGLANTIAAASNNDANFIGGGEYNISSGGFSGVMAGRHNSATGSLAIIDGGQYNAVSSTFGAIAGGEYNTVSNEGGYIGGGGYNTASGEGAIVDGGFNSTAAGTFATIPGGYVNSAAGTYSFAAGARASAAQTGTFVWSDGSDGDTILTSSRAYQFLARASGGVTFWTNAASTVGATLAPGSGTWASASDRNLKTDVAQLDDAVVLAKVAALPIERWSYKSERGVRHVGPMAQDFYAAFRVGEDDKHITSIDEDGVALAAIKALHAENALLRARLASTNARLASNDARLASTDARVARLTAVVTALRVR